MNDLPLSRYTYCSCVRQLLGKVPNGISVTVIVSLGLILSGSFQAFAQTVTCSAELFGTPYKICQHADLKLHADGSDPNGTYQWTGPNGFSSNIQNPTIANITTSGSGTYYVTFTDTQHQTAACDLTVSVKDCCFDSATPSSYLTGYLTDILANGYGIEQHVAVDGLIIDDDFTDFAPAYQNDGYEIVLFDDVSGYGILVEPGVEFEVAWANMHCCEDYVWNGIILEPGSEMTIAESYLRDAEYMIRAKGGSGVKMSNCHFHANNVGLLIPAPTSSTPFQNIYPFDLTGTEFDCENDVYVGNNKKSYAGILGYNLEYLLIDPQEVNTFHHMNNGIVMFDSYLDIRGSVFRDILPWDTLPPPVGNGIHVEKLLPTGPGRLVQSGATLSPSFENCQTGIHTVNTYLTSSENDMDDMETGYLCEATENKSISIEKNGIGATLNGVFLYYNDDASEISVIDNVIVMNDPHEADNNITGIKVIENGNQNAQEKVIFSNRIDVDYGYHGILMNTASSYQVSDNWVILYNTDINYDGVGLYNCDTNIINCNLLCGYGYDEHNVSYAPRSITLASSVYNDIDCNSLVETYCGISAEENCAGSYFRGNVFNEHTYGFRANPQCILPDQIDLGNYWNDCSIYKGAVDENQNSNLYFTADICPYTPYYFSPSGLFYSSTNDPYLCEENYENCDLYYEREDFQPSGFQEVDSLIALGALEFESFGQGMNWTMARYLYQKIINNGNDELGEIFVNFRDSLSGVSAGQFQDLENLQKNAFIIDGDLTAELSLIDELIKNVSDSLRTVDSLYKNAQNEDDAEEYITLYQGLLQALSYYTDLGDSLLADAREYRSSMVAELIDLNQSLPDDEIYEMNEKTVNAIYLASVAMGIDSLTTSQKSQLASIACQCPVSGGTNGVYRARGLLSKYGDLFYDDAQICLEEGIIS